MKRFFWVLCLVILFPIGAINAETNQYGSQYDDSIPLKPIGYIFESEEVDGKIFSFQGTITALCKNDGCWFKLKDNAHEILVDLKPFDFRTHKEIVGKKVKLNGKVNTQNGKTKIDAISVVEID